MCHICTKLLGGVNCNKIYRHRDCDSSDTASRIVALQHRVLTLLVVVVVVVVDEACSSLFIEDGGFLL